MNRVVILTPYISHMLKNNRTIFASLSLVTMAFGLISRIDQLNLPEFVELYVGDMLWALLVFWLVCFLFPNRKASFVAGIALVFAYCIEFSQLYQAQWINDIRHTTLGGLVLGFGFKWSDLVAYAVGILLGFSLKNLMTSIDGSKRKD